MSSGARLLASKPWLLHCLRSRLALAFQETIPREDELHSCALVGDDRSRMYLHNPKATCLLHRRTDSDLPRLSGERGGSEIIPRQLLCLRTLPSPVFGRWWKVPRTLPNAFSLGMLLSLLCILKKSREKQ